MFAVLCFIYSSEHKEGAEEMPEPQRPTPLKECKKAEPGNSILSLSKSFSLALRQEVKRSADPEHPERDSHS